MKNTVIKRKISVQAPVETVWNALADFGNIQNLSPNVKTSYLISDQKNGIGTTRHCDFTSFGASVDEKIIEWEEFKSMRIELFNLKRLPMMKNLQGQYELTSQGNRTNIYGTFRYDMTNSVGSLLNSLNLRKTNTRAWEQVLAGIKHYIETGEKVTKQTKLPLSAVAEF